MYFVKQIKSFILVVFVNTFFNRNGLIQATRRLSSKSVSPPPSSSTFPLFTKYQPKTQIQIDYVNALTNSSTNMVVAIGPAGTGKSLFACINAIQSLKKKNTEKIILTRPLVSVAGEDIGFLPGNLNNKMSIWVKPMIDIFSEYLSKKEINNLIQSNIIEVTPLLYMRGRTFKNTIIIADEIQNTTPQQLLMLLTRCGDNSKIVITGDLNQSDLKEKNGLEDFIEKYQRKNTNVKDIIKVVEFTGNDIQRSDLVKNVLDIYGICPIKSKDILPPISPTSSSTLNREYMNQINNYISKIPSEYGDYLYSGSILNTPPTVENKISNDDSALIPIHHMIKLPPAFKP